MNTQLRFAVNTVVSRLTAALQRLSYLYFQPVLHKGGLRLDSALSTEQVYINKFIVFIITISA